MGASTGAFQTQIVFPDERVNTRQYATSVSIGRSVSPRFSWSATVTLLQDGTVGGRDLRDGAGISAGAGVLALYERRARPFLLLTGDAGVSSARATADDGRLRDWNAADLRAGVLVGKTFGEAVPYFTVRAFGGPVSWRLAGKDVYGGDRDHVTAGAGLTIRSGRDADFTAELLPFGERSATLGATWHFR